MPIPFPTRAASHQIEEISVRHFQNALPGNWTAEKPTPDYGVDLRVDIFEGNDATGLELLVQLKAAADATQGDTETVQLRAATYNYLWNKLQVAMLVKFVESEQQAYWMLFRDIPSPPQGQETFTVHIPKSNKISEISWSEIQEYVRGVTDKKLAAMRRQELAGGNADV